MCYILGVLHVIVNMSQQCGHVLEASCRHACVTCPSTCARTALVLLGVAEVACGHGVSETGQHGKADQTADQARNWRYE